MINKGTVVTFLFWAALTVPALLLGVFPPHAQTAVAAASSREPRRLAIYPPVLAAYVTIDAEASHILALSETEKHAVNRGLLGRIFPDLQRLPSLSTVGGRSFVPADPEQALLLAPDGVIVWAWATGGLEKVGVPIEQISSTDLVATWQKVGEITRKPDRAGDFIAAFEKSERELVETLDHLPVKKEQRALVIWHNGIGGWNVASTGNRQAQYIKMLGAADPPRGPRGTERSLQVNVESILLFNPEIMFISNRAFVDDSPQAYYDDPIMQSIEAVRRKRIYKEPIQGGRMDSLVEWPLVLRWYAELLYPDDLTATLRQDLKRAYEKAYGFEINDDEIDEMLLIRENGLSSDYRRFGATATN